MLRSPEQAKIIDTVLAGSNVIANAVAGSGKTSTVLMLARETPKRILSITYNSVLAEEVRRKAHDIENLEIHTYHSFALKYYMPHGHTDADLQNMIQVNTPPKQGVPHFDIIVIDESQDMTQLYYHTVDKYISESDGKQTLLILGDKEQGIYQFKGADTRYLTLADKIRFSRHAYSFVHCELKTSYRLTAQIAWFINRCMLGVDRIQAAKEGPKVEYVSCDIYKQSYKYVLRAIIQELRRGIISPGDIFVLAPSITGNMSPIKKIENELVLEGYKCFVPNTDDEKIDDSYTRNKIVFSSFHQSKGRERPFVIVMGFDASYFKYYCRDGSDEVCPSALYVAASRASYRLMLIKNSKAPPLKFLKLDFTPEDLRYVSCIGACFQTKAMQRAAEKTYHSTSATELIRFLRTDHLLRAATLLPKLFKCMTDGASLVHLKNAQDTEKVAHLNGIAIPALYAKKSSGYMHLDQKIETMSAGFKENDEPRRQFYARHIRCMMKMEDTIEKHLYTTNIYASMKEMLFNSLAQIKKYDWMTPDHINVYMYIMQYHIPYTDTMLYEYSLPTYKYISEQYGMIHVDAVLDGLNDEIIWEFKCVETMQQEHYLQLVVYAWLWMAHRPASPRRFKLLNIRTGFAAELTYDHAVVSEIINILFENKYGPRPTMTDEEFIMANQPTDNDAGEIGDVNDSEIFD
jgi:hypothetical protein